MRRALMIAGAALVFAGPALADEVVIEKRTITRDVPESGSTVSTVIVAPNPPPPPRAEMPPPSPGPAMVWVPGRWSWDPAGGNYAWADGRYAEPPRPRAAWLPGQWTERAHGWVWVDGRWD